MPVQKYYCDYCDKQFQNTPVSRKRHLQSTQHLRARAVWYDTLKRDPTGALLQPGGSGGKRLCHYFARKGSCKYGDACRYFHPRQNAPGPAQALANAGVPPGSLQSQHMGGNSLTGSWAGDYMGLTYHNLPPSLRPPPESGYPPLPFVDWG